MRTQESMGGLRQRVLRDELDRSFERYPLLRVDLQPPSGGWLKAIRTSLGMTAKQLGRRVGVGQSVISEAEASEAEGRITLKTLQKISDGLECDVVYALVPRGSLTALVHNRANGMAHRMVGEVSHGMSLEAQATDEATREREVVDARERLIATGSSHIWD